jgi:aconitate hydratase
MAPEPAPVTDIEGARVLALLADSITTDHISPAGSIARKGPAADYFMERQIRPQDFNSYGSRRGNHEVMMRGTFANIRLRNEVAPGTEGGWTRLMPEGLEMSIFDAAMKYQAANVPLVIIAGREYGAGSSRDWAAKGPRLLGVRAVIAASYERIHRSNLIGMGVLPLQFVEGEDASGLGLGGGEIFDIIGIEAALSDAARGKREVTVHAQSPNHASFEFTALVRADTPQEVAYFRHGGILQYVLRGLLAKSA